MQKSRTPQFEQHANQIAQALFEEEQRRRYPTPASLREFVEDHPELREQLGDEVDYDSLHESLLDGSFALELDRNETVRQMLMLGRDLAPAYVQLNWHALRPERPEKSFVTSDSPVRHGFNQPPAMAAPGRAGELPQDIQVVIPLAADCCLVMENGTTAPPFAEVDDETVRRFNLMTTAAADRVVIARDEALVTSLSTAPTAHLIGRTLQEAIDESFGGTLEERPSNGEE